MTRDSGGVSRRQVTQASLVGAAALALEAGEAAAQPKAKPPGKKRYALVGAGHRANMYQEAIRNVLRERGARRALRHESRAPPARRRRRQEKGQARAEGLRRRRLRRMIAENKPDTVYRDDRRRDARRVHPARDALGCDVITEKPMTTDAAEVPVDHRRPPRDRQEVHASRSTIATRRVRSQIKELLMGGDHRRRAVGRVQLAARHVSRRRLLPPLAQPEEESGGLMVHKATHHFDLVNWWLVGDRRSRCAPSASASSTRRRWRRRLGLASQHERCLTCPEKEKCTFELDLADERVPQVALSRQRAARRLLPRPLRLPPRDRHRRHMNVIVKYDKGATLSYTLNAFAPWEGYTMRFNGTKGRLEHKMENRMRDARGSERPREPCNRSIRTSACTRCARVRTKSSRARGRAIITAAIP